ncbi:MAG: hypothetical protein OXJ55_09590, partial [Caldilineaceae bacterium]|nr:hypothetical protein [Caldilineaceae bacterium]
MSSVVCKVSRLRTGACGAGTRPPAHDFGHGQPVFAASFVIACGEDWSTSNLGPGTYAAEGSSSRFGAVSAAGGSTPGKVAVGGGDSNCGNDAPVHGRSGNTRVAGFGMDKGQLNP